MQRVEILRDSPSSIGGLSHGGDFLVVDVDSREYLQDAPKVLAEKPSSGRVVARPASAKGFSDDGKELAKVRNLIKKAKIKESKRASDGLASGGPNFCLADEIKAIADDGALFYSKFFTAVGLDVFRRKNSKIKKRETSFLIKIYRDADSQDLDALLARLFIGALGLKRGLKVRIVL